MSKIYLIGFLILMAPEALARPEYALQIMTNRCTTCHVNPIGGGHRNLVGKAFGPASAPLESFSQQDVFGFDFRTILYSPVKKSDRDIGTNGLGIMAALPSVYVPFKKTEDQEWSFVYSHNVGGFYGISPKDAYLRIQFYEDYRFYPQHILIGRFNAPFGLLDDEHRTYIRQQTRGTWNDLEMGILFSGNWSAFLHYDLAVVNGEQTAGTSFGHKRATVWGGIANMRLFLMDLGWMLGGSASYYTNDTHSSALSLYQNLSIGRLTQQWLPGNLTAEMVLARQMNSRVTTLFFSDSTYAQQVKEGQSLGYKVQWNYNFQPDWKLIFKYDYLIFDLNYANDSYQRYGFGLRHFFSNQLSAQLRYEKAVANPASEQNVKIHGSAAKDIIWVLMQVKI